MNYETDKEEFLHWLDEVLKSTSDLLKQEDKNFSNSFVLTIDTNIINLNNTSEGIVAFAKENMAQEEFDDVFPPYYTIVFSYAGDRDTLDNVRDLRVQHSSISDFFNHYYYSMSLTYDVSVNKAAHKLKEFFDTWKTRYIRF